VQLRRKLNIGLAAALVVLATVSGYSLLNLGALARTDGWVYRTQETRALVRSTLASLTDAESSERAYILTGDTSYLDAYNRSVVAVDSHVIALEAIEGDDVLEEHTVRRVAPMMAERISMMHAAVEARRTHGESAAASMLPLDRGVRDSLRHALNALDRAELSQLGPRQDRAERQARHAMAVVIAGTLVATMLAVVLGLMLRRDSLGRQKSEALYRGVIDVLAEGVFVRDLDGTIVECNPSAERILGLTREEILDMKTGQLECFREDGTPMPP
jgi:CHASE3 domain sensor protein